MNVARQISRRFGRAMGTRTRSATDYSISATLSAVPDPLESGVGTFCFVRLYSKDRTVRRGSSREIKSFNITCGRKDTKYV